MKRLKILNLSGNKIVGLPLGVKGSLLEELYLYENMIEIVPDGFFVFEKLRVLNLRSNRIRVIPEGISRMNNL